MRRVNNCKSNISRLLFPALSVALFLSSCTKDPIRETPVDPDPIDTTPVAQNYSNGVFVVNEGNYNWGNASISFIDKSSGKVLQDVFNKVNGRSLGDVAQSMTVVGNRGYIVVNNSNRVEVINTKDCKSVTSILGFNSPRYITVVDENKAYVSNLHQNISVVDLNSNTIKTTIKTNSWTENMIQYQSSMFVNAIGSFNEPNSNRRAQVYIISTKEDRITDSIQTGKEPLGMVMDKKEKIWVLCTGGYDNFEPPALLRINPETRSVEKAFVFPAGQGAPSKLCINPTGDTLYFLKGGVFQMPVNAATLPSEPFIPSNGALFYGLAIHPNTGSLYVSDALDYVQNGRVLIFNQKTGEKRSEYPAGRIPGSFCFTAVQK